MSVWRKGIIYFAVMNSVPISDSSDEDMTNLMMVAMVKTGPLNVGKGSFSERNM